MNHHEITTVHRIGPKRLRAVLAVPESAVGLVIFAHGSDSSCVSPRNEHIASRLNQDGIATLLFDFLTGAESSERENSFKPPLLADRLMEVIAWTQQQNALNGLPVGLFGSGTGMAAVIVAAANQPIPLRAIVGRGGRTDLVSRWLEQVTVPTLFIVGELDHSLLIANQIAAHTVKGESRFQVINGASHLFSEAGKLSEVAEIAAEWFVTHLDATAPTSVPPG
ncbi:Putative phosphoribosyl transferase/MT0597 [Rubripirellula lacrimiformis]|uniref:Phosphoribosyl transferase/MT0597 n=1 Tax=Rubripirellula lacrimiformis TaxID=1930273 RepID=A0A517N4R6_9BACT|nr:alpha/beta family hydrolase [Rubripirellula lacrimiformis]QDT02119.1 Putative phosphoribosyl transferase/MT0597 [Rubripirellula lacrimiformis]